MPSLIDQFKLQAGKNPLSIVLPESDDDRILESAVQATKEKLAKIVLIGDESTIKSKLKQKGLDMTGITIIKPENYPKFQKYIEIYCKMRGVRDTIARRILSNPLHFAAMMVKAGDAHGLIAGAVYTSAEVIVASQLILGLQQGISCPSSFFLSEIPNYDGGERGMLIFADASVNPQPAAEQLADIAITSARTAESLLRWVPRVAMLSFSTKGSAIHPDVEKVIQATKLARQKAPNLLIDGELQGDSALLMATAQKKIKDDLGPVAGRANILIFPDLDAGNISYKLVQTLAKANFYGPILQGFSKPVSDLSRGAKVSDIVGVIALLVCWAQGMK